MTRDFTAKICLLLGVSFAVAGFFFIDSTGWILSGIGVVLATVGYALTPKGEV